MKDALFPVALSVMSSPAMMGLWEHLPGRGAAEIYERLKAKAVMATQDYIAVKYGNDPLVSAEKIINISRSRSINIIHYWSDLYPSMLLEIERPPLVLYTRGDFIFSDAVAVVGTRRADVRSRKSARAVSERLARHGYTVVSGMAIGIDREAHCAALDAGGTTIGILANGIDIVYPLANRDLYQRIVNTRGSGLISEYPPGILAGKWTFVRRNRIISGLSLGTVVIKAAKKSGALITARYALEQNRDVFACSGYSFDDDYEGCHELIRSGAVLVSRCEDIISELKPRACRLLSIKDREDDHEPVVVQEPSDVISFFSPEEEQVMKIISGGDNDIDSIIRKAGIGAGKINEILVGLELSGKILKEGNSIILV